MSADGFAPDDITAWRRIIAGNMAHGYQGDVSYKTLIGAFDVIDTLRATLSRVEAERDGLRARIDAMMAKDFDFLKEMHQRLDPFGRSDVMRVHEMIEHWIDEMDKILNPATITEGEKP